MLGPNEAEPRRRQEPEPIAPYLLGEGGRMSFFASQSPTQCWCYANEHSGEGSARNCPLAFTFWREGKEKWHWNRTRESNDAAWKFGAPSVTPCCTVQRWCQTQPINPSYVGNVSCYCAAERAIIHFWGVAKCLLGIFSLWEEKKKANIPSSGLTSTIDCQSRTEWRFSADKWLRSGKITPTSFV